MRHTTNVSKLVWVGLMLTLLVTAAPAPAQQGDNQADLISLEFRGGSAADYIEAIRRSAGELNILFPPEAADVRIPPVKLNRTSVWSALRLLDGHQQSTQSGSIELAVEALPVVAHGERATYVIHAGVSGRRPRLAMTHVWSTTFLLQNEIPSKALLDAVELAIEVVASSSEVDVRFHEDTGLLIARGNTAQLEAIDSVLDQLKDSVNSRLSDPLREAERQTQTASAALDLAEARLVEEANAKSNALEEVRAMRMEIESQQLRVAHLQRMLDEKEAQLARTLEELRVLRARIPGG